MKVCDYAIVFKALTWLDESRCDLSIICYPCLPEGPWTNSEKLFYWKQAVGRQPPWYAPTQACKWWRICRTHMDRSPLLYVYFGLPVQPTKAAWWSWPFDLESGVPVTCDVGYLCANFCLPSHLCSRVKPDVRDRQTSDKSIANAPAY